MGNCCQRLGSNILGTSKNALFLRWHRWRRIHRPKALAMLAGPTVLMYGLYTAVFRAPPPHYHRKITIFRETHSARKAVNNAIYPSNFKPETSLCTIIFVLTLDCVKPFVHD